MHTTICVFISHLPSFEFHYPLPRFAEAFNRVLNKKASESWSEKITTGPSIQGSVNSFEPICVDLAQKMDRPNHMFAIQEVQLTEPSPGLVMELHFYNYTIMMYMCETVTYEPPNLCKTNSSIVVMPAKLASNCRSAIGRFGMIGKVQISHTRATGCLHIYDAVHIQPSVIP